MGVWLFAAFTEHKEPRALSISTGVCRSPDAPSCRWERGHPGALGMLCDDRRPVTLLKSENSSYGSEDPWDRWLCLIYKQIKVQVEESGPGKSCDQRVLESKHRLGSLTLTSCGWGPPDYRAGLQASRKGRDCRAHDPHLRVRQQGG